MTEKVAPFLNKTNNTKKNAKIIRCDNSSENKTLGENCAKYFEEINFEFMSPGTTQKNDVVELGFATFYSWDRVMMAHSGLHKNLKTSL